MYSGAGDQFFDQNGLPLAGGLLYTYGSGGVLPEATYTTINGNVQHSNPIQLDAEGRVPAGGEIWLTDGNSYKIVVNDADGGLVGTYDNITGNASGILSGFASSSGSSLIGFIQAGSGAVLRTAQSKLRERVTPDDYGAVGDGVTNDSTAMQAAITYATSVGGTVRLNSSKNYLCSSIVDVTCNIYGDGGTITGSLRVAGDDITVRDVNVVSNNAVYGVFLAGSTVTPTIYYRQKLERVNITFSPGTAVASSLGIMATNINYMTIDGCEILYGMQLVGCADFTITNNLLDGDNFTNTNELLHASLKSYGIISNNTFMESLDNYIDLYTSGERCVIQGNRFISCKTRLGTAVEIKVSLTDTSNTSSDTNGWDEQILIDGNYFGDTRANGVQFTSIISVAYSDTRSVPSFSWANTCRNIAITNNIFDGFDGTAHGASYFAPIYLFTSNAILVSGNIFRNMALVSANDLSSCVWIEKCRDVIVTGNRISMKAGTGVSLHDACEDITVSDNHMLEDLNKSQVLSYGIRITKEGSRPAPTVTRGNFTGNVIYCTISAFRHLYVAGTSLTDCLIADNTFQQECTMAVLNRCQVIGNRFTVGAARSQCLTAGTLSQITAFNLIANNTFVTPSGTPKIGLDLIRMRCSNINANTVHTATYGFFIQGTNTAGELDYLNVKDNFSVSQTMANFPTYSSMNAADTALLQAVNNQKVT